MAKKVKAKAEVVKAEKPEITEITVTETSEIAVEKTWEPVKVDVAVLAGHISKAMKRYLKNKGK